MLKRLLNMPERITYQRLAELCARRRAQVFSKVRLADVLPIEGSGLADDLFSFALRAHFDFVVTDRDERPSFAVEFDGPTHGTEAQAGRDAKKDQLARYFGLPLLRVQAGDLHRTEARLDRLTGVAERWFDRATPSAGRSLEPERWACPLCGAE